MSREKKVILLGTACGTNFYPGGPETLSDAIKEGDSFCPNFDKCDLKKGAILLTHQCVMQMGHQVAQFVVKQGNNVHDEVQGDLRRDFGNLHAPEGFIWSEDRKKFEIVKDKEKVLELIEKFAVMVIGGQRFGEATERKRGNLTQHPVSTDGISIDLGETARLSAERVERQGGAPVHACGKVGKRECPCFTCTSNNCAACFADMF